MKYKIPSKNLSTSLTPMVKSSNSLEEIPKIVLPLSLTTEYKPYIENIQNCLLFLERFADSHESIAKLAEVYNNSPDKFSEDIDLDKLARDADLSRSEFRILIDFALDKLIDQETLMALRLSKKHLVQKAIEIALNDKHPDSFQERKALLEYHGIRALPKGVSINVNTGQQTTVVQQGQIVNGLPTFMSTIADSEKTVNETIKSLVSNSIDVELENSDD